MNEMNETKTAAARTITITNTDPNIVWKNDFFALRHGRSVANERQLIVSRPPWAVAAYGLSSVGKAQAALVRIPPTSTGSSRVVEDADENDRPVILITSDFRRAVETAEIVQQTHQHRHVPTQLHTDVRLRERDFGRYDLTSDANYHIVWAHDGGETKTTATTTAADDHDDDGVESVESVLRRGRQCMEEWNDVYTDCNIVLVAHGDVLQILQTSFVVLEATEKEEDNYNDYNNTNDEDRSPPPVRRLDPHQHRTLPHLETAVPRLLVRRGQIMYCHESVSPHHQGEEDET